jgi:hypothetical protein
MSAKKMNEWNVERFLVGVLFLSTKKGAKLSEKQSQDKSPPSLETFRRRN